MTAETDAVLLEFHDDVAMAEEIVHLRKLVNVEPGVEATRVNAIKNTLLDAFSGAFSVRLPQAIYDLAHGQQTVHMGARSVGKSAMEQRGG